MSFSNVPPLAHKLADMSGPACSNVSAAPPGGFPQPADVTGIKFIFPRVDGPARRVGAPRGPVHRPNPDSPLTPSPIVPSPPPQWVIRDRLLIGPHPSRLSTAPLSRNLAELLKEGASRHRAPTVDLRHRPSTRSRRPAPAPPHRAATGVNVFAAAQEEISQGAPGSPTSGASSRRTAYGSVQPRAGTLWAPLFPNPTYIASDTHFAAQNPQR